MATLNQNYTKLGAGYLFPEIAKRTNEFQKANPDATIRKLGIGNTTEPITPAVAKGLINGVMDLIDVETYSGYGAEQGNTDLRQAISDFYKKDGVDIDPSEIFVSDGAKPDSANIQSIFGLDNIIAVEDPAYPVYVDTNVIAGRTGNFVKETGQYEGIIYLPCNEENNFMPELPDNSDIDYLCSPNNPTGAVRTRESLQKAVDKAIDKKSVIIFDAAYRAFIRDESLPKSIYEIPGAEKCAIEINSLSKSHGFTGIRLGWTVVPKSLTVEATVEGEVNSVWNRRQCTFFNGASNIVQPGAIAAFSPEGMAQSREQVDFYLANAKIIKTTLDELGLTTYGGENSSYIWMKTPNNMSSWDFFDKLLDETHVVGTPGVGFGPSGEGYFRLSSFGHREDIEEAVHSIRKNLNLDKPRSHLI